ncbi:redoxin domain-containing protein [Methanosarcina sp. 2.H.A.1B.4]|uniref:redoxin domain-containing protein n=1 Tax=Methanosarcina sp. 2.H.A.1B.4 TaxID=1483600 RepID=UPI000ABC1D17|nr:redoxin domain-containing protein [Methanosarcina sp. 2.H.A.1B.4]
MTTEVKIGKTIQDFRLKDQRREEMHLYDLKRKKVLLSFHPLAWTQSAHNR